MNFRAWTLWSKRILRYLLVEAGEDLCFLPSDWSERIFLVRNTWLPSQEIIPRCLWRTGLPSPARRNDRLLALLTALGAWLFSWGCSQHSMPEIWLSPVGNGFLVSWWFWGVGGQRNCSKSFIQGYKSVSVSSLNWSNDPLSLAPNAITLETRGSVYGARARATHSSSEVEGWTGAQHVSFSAPAPCTPHYPLLSLRHG